MCVRRYTRSRHRHSALVVISTGGLSVIRITFFEITAVRHTILQLTTLELPRLVLDCYQGDVNNIETFAILDWRK